MVRFFYNTEWSHLCFVPLVFTYKPKLSAAWNAISVNFIFFKLLLSHSLKILVIFCRNIFAILYWSANHTSGQWDHWEQSCLPLLCLPSLCSWCPPHSALLRIVPVRKRMMKNALSKLAFLSKPTGFDILPHLSTASRGKSTKIFFTLFLRFLFC